MNNEPSRSGFRELNFYETAENGGFKANVHLFSKEAKALIKKGFKVKRLGTSFQESLPSIVSWDEAFPKCLPPIVYGYITGIVKIFPKGLNWAQELYCIAARANFIKEAQNNNE